MAIGLVGAIAGAAIAVAALSFFRKRPEASTPIRSNTRSYVQQEE